MKKKNLAAMIGVIGGSLATVQFFVEPGALPVQPAVVSAVGGTLLLVAGIILFSMLWRGEVRKSPEQ
ncbi:hypothetical protein [Haloarchaeobius sp. HRN-SO-5]|uniref:hypothetical protein n=1 Tax=Haloarchaeobius sp. HRN-SO-5 TaxID=3446118 RepID=UPI003EBC213A